MVLAGRERALLGREENVPNLIEEWSDEYVDPDGEIRIFEKRPKGCGWASLPTVQSARSNMGQIKAMFAAEGEEVESLTLTVGVGDPRRGGFEIGVFLDENEHWQAVPNSAVVWEGD